ncbi:uroporphyrinogen-iii synthase [Niveomyces insectorum RCEF 264]|uniref:Uroporphyrinogen-iii synthase n=1 Tax=Niveomyces insectorum RCEF 264 TaxID=1081102 RepID=A0A167MLI8_9HYPO|nr:uroporphyrinogen-iii synthase [Niveomyces insectorum RCEF 264]
MAAATTLAADAPALSPPPSAIPVLLLKTKSAPTDAYEELLSQATTSIHGDGDGDLDGNGNGNGRGNGGRRLAPMFVPVLAHGMDDDGVARLTDLLVRRQFMAAAGTGNTDGGRRRYGGLIFTSQRAVEAFAAVVAQGDDDTLKDAQGGEDGQDGKNNTGWPHLQDVPVYSVGPATTRALRAVHQEPALQVCGDHTGNGEALAYFIREHYVGLHSSAAAEKNAETGSASAALPPLLFVVGEKRRDIIPKVLMGTDDDDDDNGDDGTLRAAVPRIPVDELVVYRTGVMPSFVADLRRVLHATQDRPVRWVVVFSPTGCDGLLAELGLLDPATGRAREGSATRRRNQDGAGTTTTFVATIGPTTQSYLRDTFGFEPDVCADEPSPQGVLRGITQFMAAAAA